MTLERYVVPLLVAAGVVFATACTDDDKPAPLSNGGATGGSSNAGGTGGASAGSGGGAGHAGEAGGTGGASGASGGSVGGMGGGTSGVGGTEAGAPDAIDAQEEPPNQCTLSSGIAACDSCVNLKCFPECHACAKEPACIALMDCMSQCAPGDGTCAAGCAAASPAGADAYLAYRGQGGCRTLYCGDECSGATRFRSSKHRRPREHTPRSYDPDTVVDGPFTDSSLPRREVRPHTGRKLPSP